MASLASDKKYWICYVSTRDWLILVWSMLVQTHPSDDATSSFLTPKQTALCRRSRTCFLQRRKTTLQGSAEIFTSLQLPTDHIRSLINVTRNRSLPENIGHRRKFTPKLKTLEKLKWQYKFPSFLAIVRLGDSGGKFLIQNWYLHGILPIKSHPSAKADQLWRVLIKHKVQFCWKVSQAFKPRPLKE